MTHKRSALTALLALAALTCTTSVALPSAAADAAPKRTWRTAAVTPTPTTTAPAAVCGTWVLQQVSSRTELDRQASAIDAALAQPGVVGLSLRLPWSTLDQDFGIVDRGRAIAAARGKTFSVRFMAGRWTPSRVFAAGAHSYLNTAGERVPKPFSDSGVAGNPVFEREFAATASRLASWSRANGAKLLHLPWYGNKWAEIYNGEDLQQTKGYSYSAWLAGHQRLVQVSYPYSGSDLSIEFALSGHWGGKGTGSGDVSDAIVSVAGSWNPRVLVQGNGLGIYNNAATNRAIFHAKQMYDGKDYDWSAIYDTLVANDDEYVEVYTSSFSQPRRAELLSEARAFHAANC